MNEEKKLDKDINVRSKLTDEEIVQALECCEKCESCVPCPYFIKKIDCVYNRRAEGDVLDLIHRLQSENERLKKPRKYILANKVYTDSTLKGWTKEDLIEQIRILEHNWAVAEERINNSVKNSDKIFAEQKAEIERLTEEKGKYQEKWQTSYMNELNLQKQVDELKEERQSLVTKLNQTDEAVDYWCDKFKAENAEKDELTDKLGKVLSTVGIDEYQQSKAVEQAVKDTAKEIYTQVLEWLPVGEDYSVFIHNIEQWLKERYGVEVE